mgnify:FL=1|tara:strand:+ start:2994 stop:4664 length:1671 start_codon:yes stop_codon:yes gene_type:complete
MALAFTKTNRSAFTNFLRSKYEMFTGAEQVETLPYYLCLDPSDTCQLRCPTCPTGIENESKKQKDAVITNYRSNRKMLSMELMDNVLDELGDKLFLIMFYNYGEPLLNPNLHQYIRKATDKNIATEVHSNLSLTLSDQRIEQLLSSGLNRISASIDGYSQEAYEIHRVGGNVELVRENLKRLATARDKLGADTDIYYKYLVFKHNEHEIEDARKFAEDIGVIFSTADAMIHDQAWLPSHREHEEPYFSTKELGEIMERWKEAGKEDYFFEHESHQFWNAVPKNFGEHLPRTCGWHYGFSVIAAGGPVAPCCASSKDKDDFGTIVPGKTSFADIWNNELYRKSRNAMAGKPSEAMDHVDTVCMRCHYPKVVQHLYNNHDMLVAERFDQVFGESEPQMSKAFALLGDGLLTADAEGFIAHYEQHLSMSSAAGNMPPQRIITERNMPNDEATNILQLFGNLIAEIGLNGSEVFDDSLLRHSKEDIKSAIVALLSADVTPDQQDFAKGALPALAFFQAGVGQTSLALDSEQSTEQTWRRAVEADMQKICQEVGARSHSEL